jgi:hypothetical protein
MAAELADYAALANQEAKGLEGLGGFDIGMTAEAETLARQLRERPTTPASPENTRRALDIRNRVATLLLDKISLVRSAARFVFRNQPDIVRLSTSAFERRRRKAQRAKANAQEKPPAPAPSPNNGAGQA